MEHGLHNLYLHHSYFPSVLTKLSCNTHTNITGDNGAGETTLLSLIPIFYGIEPGENGEQSGRQMVELKNPQSKPFNTLTIAMSVLHCMAFRIT